MEHPILGGFDELVHKLSKPYRVKDGKHFRLKDCDPADTRGLELDKEEG